MTWQDVVAHIDDTCGEEKDFIILLKQETKAAASDTIRAALTVDRAIGEIMLQGRIHGVEATFFCNGKLILKGLRGRAALEMFLQKLFG